MGGPRYPYPKYIWSPSGGWWNNPPNWRAATAIAISVQILFSVACIQYQDKIAVYYNTRDYTATRPRGVYDSSIWDNTTRLPTGAQYKGLSSDTGRKVDEDDSENQDENTSAVRFATLHPSTLMPPTTSAHHARRVMEPRQAIGIHRRSHYSPSIRPAITNTELPVHTPAVDTTVQQQAILQQYLALQQQNQVLQQQLQHEQQRRRILEQQQHQLQQQHNILQHTVPTVHRQTSNNYIDSQVFSPQLIARNTRSSVQQHASVNPTFHQSLIDNTMLRRQLHTPVRSATVQNNDTTTESSNTMRDTDSDGNTTLEALNRIYSNPPTDPMHHSTLDTHEQAIINAYTRQRQHQQNHTVAHNAHLGMPRHIRRQLNTQHSLQHTNINNDDTYHIPVHNVPRRGGVMRPSNGIPARIATRIPHTHHWHTHVHHSVQRVPAKHVVDNLEKHTIYINNDTNKYSDSTAVDEDIIECSICLDTFKHLEVVTRLPCNHDYHNECVSKWFAKSNQCPKCRYELDTVCPRLNAEIHAERDAQNRRNSAARARNYMSRTPIINNTAIISSSTSAISSSVHQSIPINTTNIASTNNVFNALITVPDDIPVLEHASQHSSNHTQHYSIDDDIQVLAVRRRPITPINLIDNDDVQVVAHNHTINNNQPDDDNEYSDTSSIVDMNENSDVSDADNDNQSHVSYYNDDVEVENDMLEPYDSDVVNEWGMDADYDAEWADEAAEYD